MSGSEIVRLISRYRPFVILVVGVLLVALVLPMRDDDTAVVSDAAGAPQSPFGGQAGQPTGSGSDPASSIPASGEVPGETAVDQTAGTSARAEGSSGVTAVPSATNPTPTESVEGGLQPTGVVANCDQATGRIMVPTVYAPPCVQTFDGNAGATWQGVTENTIKVAIYLPQFGAGAAGAYIAAGGDADAIDPDTMKQIYEGFREYFNQHYETYGREVEFVYVEASGGNQDAQAAKADAIRVAEEHKAFASVNGPAALQYAQELAARGVMCLTCINGLPIEYYETYAPFMWTERPGWSVGALHVGEIIGKMLWDRPARFAGDPTMHTKTRSFANVYYDIPEQAYKAGAERLDRVMAEYGAKMADTIPYPFDLSAAQSQARTIIARLKSKGITTVLMATDWAYPVFFTQEATKQNYNPEWFSSGASVLNVFGRTYDQTQWANAFSANIAPVAASLTEPYRLWEWQFGEEIPATCCYWPVWLLFTGTHMAGPSLTPQTFQAGMFAYPPSGGRASNQVWTMQMSFGSHGGFGFDDYTGVDDLDLAWWDPTAVGEDEVGNQGTGMWRHMDGGRHYLPGEYGWEEPNFFDPAGTVLLHKDFPEGEEPPSYPPPGRR